MMMLVMFVMLHMVAGGPVDRKRNIAAVNSAAEGNSYDVADDDTAVEKILLDTLGILDYSDSEESYELEEEKSIYDSIKDEKISLLTKIERLYNVFKSKLNIDKTVDEEGAPLLAIASTGPHSLIIKIMPRKLRPDTMLHLQYERVPQHRQPAMQHLADPVEEYIPLIRTSQTFTITDLPRGKYIVCGEAMDKMGKVYQEGCLETRISQKEKKGLQTGVQVLILVSMLMMVSVILYAVMYQVCARLCVTNKVKNIK